jgi:5-methylcytosine-specific restriction endonuclease McrA
MQHRPDILQLDEAGQPNNWCSWQDAICYQAKNMIVWSLGEVRFTFYGGKSRATGDVSTVIVPSIIAVRNQNQSKTRHTRTPTLTNHNLFRRDLFICAYCGRPFKEEKLTRDHIIPVSRWKEVKKDHLGKGPNVWMNCITSCKPCNNFKDDNLLEEIDLELKYRPYVPTKAENMILANRNILPEQSDFLKNMVPLESRIHQARVGYI